MIKNMSYLNCKKIDTAINRAKRLLIEEAQKNGLYENFGQSEVRRIGDKFINSSDYTIEMNARRDKLRHFSNWCSRYNLNDMRY